MVASSMPSPPCKNVNPLLVPTLLRLIVPRSAVRRHLDGVVARVLVADADGIARGVGENQGLMLR